MAPSAAARAMTCGDSPYACAGDISGIGRKAVIVAPEVRPSTEADQEGTAPVIESLASRPSRPGWSRAVIPAAVVIGAVGLLTAAAAAENSDVAASLKVLAHLRWTWVAAGVALEVISLAAFAAMFRELLKAGRARPRSAET